MVFESFRRLFPSLRGEKILTHPSQFSPFLNSQFPRMLRVFQAKKVIIMIYLLDSQILKVHVSAGRPPWQLCRPVPRGSEGRGIRLGQRTGLRPRAAAHSLLPRRVLHCPDRLVRHSCHDVTPFLRAIRAQVIAPRATSPIFPGPGWPLSGTLETLEQVGSSLEKRRACNLLKLLEITMEGLQSDGGKAPRPGLPLSRTTSLGVRRASHLNEEPAQVLLS